MSGESHIEAMIQAVAGSQLAGESHLRHALTGGTVSACGESHILAGSLAATLPPAAANLQHWWDCTDGSALWADTAGTVPITPGANINRIDDKGLGGVPLTEAGAGTPTWTALGASMPGFNVASSPGAGSGIFPGGVSLAAPVGGFSFATVDKITATGTTHATLGYDSADLNVQAVISPATGWRMNMPGQGSFHNTGKLVVIGEWVWIYGTIDPAGNIRVRAAGVAESTPTSTYTPGGGGGTITFMNSPVDRAETMIWDKNLSPAELTQLIAYFDGRYGVMPF